MIENAKRKYIYYIENMNSRSLFIIKTPFIREKHFYDVT